MRPQSPTLVQLVGGQYGRAPRESISLAEMLTRGNSSTKYERVTASPMLRATTPNMMWKFMYPRFDLGRGRRLLLMDGVDPKNKYFYPLQRNPPSRNDILTAAIPGCFNLVLAVR